MFVFLQLPRRLAQKTKEFAKKKLRNRKKKQQGEEIVEKQVVDDDDDDDEFIELDSGKSMSMKILELEGMAVKELHNWGSCTDEVDKVLGELSLKGEFAFGSFWGKDSEIQTRKSYCNCSRSLTKEDDLEFGSHVVKFHFIQVIAPFSSS
ncbi:hypothetical protein BVRB_6g140860 [Beta vulgaris subsp. vulgaris]|nr:hypothetical protein BVRB_6g140860 [Beta vulgaris subsp. vulgaris]